MPDVTHDGRRWSNADDDRVDLVSYDPRWPSLFEAEAGRIRAALSGMLDFALEHFGSTAIPGLPAKPIIDIMVIADAPSSWAGLVEPIQNIGYVFWADNPRRDRMFFVKGMPPFGERRTHHVPRSDARGRASLDPFPRLPPTAPRAPRPLRIVEGGARGAIPDGPRRLHGGKSAVRRRGTAPRVGRIVSSVSE